MENSSEAELINDLVPEAELNIERIEPSFSFKIIHIAEHLGRLGLDVLTSQPVRDITQKILDQTYWRNTASLLLLETGILKSAAFLPIPSHAELGGAAMVPKMLVKNRDLLPSVEASTGKRSGLEVGSHLTVILTKYKDIKSRKLSDGQEVRPGQRVGELHFTRNIEPLAKDTDVISYTRMLYRSGEKSLEELAVKCERNDPAFEDINVFYGVSHIAGPLAKRLGFDIFRITNPVTRFLATYLAKKGMEDEFTGNSQQWELFKRNFKSPNFAYISRQKLIELYGERSKKNHKP